MKKNDEFLLKITALSGSGEGIGRHDGMVIFVPGATSGDLVNIRIIKVLSGRAIGKILSIIQPSSDRTDNICPVFPACGGCQFRHITYLHECQTKLNYVNDCLKRIGGLTDISAEQIVPSPSTEHYRNKALYPLSVKNGKTVFGFYRNSTHDVISCQKNGIYYPCEIHPVFFNDIAQCICDWADRYQIPIYQEENEKGLLRGIFLRHGFSSHELMVCLIAKNEKIAHLPELIDLLKQLKIELTSLIININPEKTNSVLGTKNKTVFGKSYIEDSILGITLRISPNSFYQINHDQCENLYSHAASLLLQSFPDKKPKLLDLYCGVGSIGLCLSKYCSQVLGIEIVPDAIRNAKENAKLNQITNAFFSCCDSSSAEQILQDNQYIPDIICVDPPRKGLSGEVIDFLTHSSVRHILYISCDPSTLARDLHSLSSIFSTDSVKVFDMFPRTGHVETVVLMSRDKE